MGYAYGDDKEAAYWLDIYRKKHTKIAKEVAKYIGKEEAKEAEAIRQARPIRQATYDTGKEVVMVVPPVLYKGVHRIAKSHSVSMAEVMRWVDQGAPIYKIGRIYQAWGHELWEWLSERAKSKR